MTEGLGRKRAMRAEVKITRQALKVVLPINSQIGAWQAATVRLNAMASRIVASGRYNPAVIEETETLARQIAAQKEALTREINDLPPDIAQSGRLLDTARALRTIGEGLERTLALLRRTEAGAMRPAPQSPLTNRGASGQLT